MKSKIKSILIFSFLCLSIFFIKGDWNVDRDAFASTFSIVGFCPETGELGVAVQSKFPNVRPLVPWAKAGVGAVATQSFAKIEYATRGLELMEKGFTAEEALKAVLKTDNNRQSRQVGIIDAKGNAASWTGNDCFDWGGGCVGQENLSPKVYTKSESGTLVTGKYFTAQGNILVDENTVIAMGEAFENTDGSLAEKLLAALTAGGKAGGDQRGEQSAALLVVKEDAGYDGMDNYIDISVYDHKTPIAEINRLFNLNNLYFTGSKLENMIPVTKQIAEEIQQIWIKRGFYNGPADGIVDEEFQKILIDFMGWENYDMRISEIEKVVLKNNEPLLIDIEVLEDIRKVFKNGLWKLKTN